MGSVLKKVRSPVWLTTAIVVAMILLFSLLIYHAREKEMGEQFNIQQLAQAKNIVSGIEDLFSDVERSIKTQSGHNETSWQRRMQIIYEDLGGRVELLAFEGDSGLKMYPGDRDGKIASLDEFGNAIKRARVAGRTIVSDSLDDSGKAIKGRVIIAIPLFDSGQRVKAVMAALLPISPLVERNIDSLRKGFGTNAWIINESGLFLFHTRPELTGAQMEMANALENGSLKGDILGKEETKGEFFLVNEKGEKTRNLVAHAPIRFGNARLWVGVGTHYTAALMHMKETFAIIMIEGFVLIVAVVIGSAVMIRSGRKRVVLEEEVKFLREREKWQEDLAREKRTIEGIIEGSPIASFVINKNHKIIFWNKACTELLGLRAEEMIGTDKQWMPFYPEKRPVIADIIVDQDLEHGLNMFYGEKEVQPHATIEGAYEASDYYENLGGRSRHLYFLAAPIYDENGEVIAAIETLQDVSREKEMELDLKNYAATLHDELNKNITLKRTIEGIIEGSPIAMFVIDKSHKIILWNKACTELMGLKAQEMIGTDNQWMPFYPAKRPVVADLIVDQDLEHGLKMFYGEKEVQPHAIIEGAYEVRDFYENLGGRSRHLYFLAAPIYDENGEVIAAVETLQDVSRETEMELDLKNSAATLQDELNKNITLKRTIEGIIEGSPIATFVIDKSHKIILWNKACTELTGFKGREMIGTSRQHEPFYQEKRSVIADLIVDNDMEGLKKFYGKRQMQPSAVVKGAYEAMDFYENLGGKRRHLYFLAAPIYDEKGETIAAIETLQDVTRERELELNLKEYAESLKNELDVNIRLRKDIEDMNNYLQSILESSPDRIFDLDGDGIIRYASKDMLSGTDDPKQLRGRHFTDFLDEENTKKLMQQWGEIVRGNYKPFEVSAIARDGSSRDLLISVRPIKNTGRFILVQRDITEFKDLEQKFYESQKLAAVGQLSAGIAHEVRNPLSSIKMSLQILEKRLNPTGNDQKRFKIAEKEVEHLEKLVSDILIFARPVEPDRKPVNINNLLEHSLHMAEKEIMDKGIKIETRLSEGLPEVFIDQAMIDQALLNVYLNAIDAMEPGGRLVLGTSRPQGSNFVSIIIDDSGSGIAPEDLAHIFNPFFTKKKYGTGLGLTQVKKIIDQHQGTIEISSQQGKGTRVVVNFPIAEKGGTSEV